MRSLAIYVPFVSMDSSDFANLASFTYLESIQLKDYALSKSYTQPIELGDIISLLKSFVHLKSLVLEEWYLDSFEQLQDIICACPNLEDLTLDNVRLSIPKMPSDKPTVCRTPPPLRALRVRETDSEGQLVDWLASHPAAIATLTLTCDGFSYNNPHGHLFSKLGSSLKNLQIFCSCKQQGMCTSFKIFNEHNLMILTGSCSNKIDEMIDLRHNTHLETLTLWSPVNCFALVEQISSSRIQEINIDTDVQSVMPNFEEIDTFLQRGNLAGLDGFNLLGSWPADTTQELDSKLLPCGSPRFAHLVRYQDIFGLRAFRSGIVRDEDLNQLRELL